MLAAVDASKYPGCTACSDIEAFSQDHLWRLLILLTYLQSSECCERKSVRSDKAQNSINVASAALEQQRSKVRQDQRNVRCQSSLLGEEFADEQRFARLRYRLQQLYGSADVELDMEICTDPLGTVLSPSCSAAKP